MLIEPLNIPLDLITAHISSIDLPTISDWAKISSEYLQDLDVDLA